MTTASIATQGFFADPDHLLVERARRGDSRSYKSLFDKYSPRVRRLVSRHVSDPDEVAEVTQEAFIRAFRALPQFKGESRFFTWLYRIALNTSRNSLARVRRIRRVELENVPIEDGDSGMQYRDEALHDETPESLLATRQVADAVQAAVAALPEDLRAALLLREVEGLKYEEIARQLDVPIGTVRSRIFRAREAIAIRLQDVRDRGTSGRF
jgi:RNA polymerase sigma-70 factor (ECF subfamily)